MNRRATRTRAAWAALTTAAMAAAMIGNPSQAHAQALIGADRAKLLLTAGFSDIEGAGGAGLVPWAVITGYGSRDGWGANAHVTGVRTQDIELAAYGVAVGVFDRFELSYTRHDLEFTSGALDRLGVTQDIIGAKLRVFGDAVYAQDSWLPQIAIGLEYKEHGGIDDAAAVGLPGLVNPRQLGARDDQGIDYYLAATKVVLDSSFVYNVTARYTEANQFGLLGFGGERKDDPSLQLEASAAYLLARSLAIGAEYRSKPRNLAADREEDAWDIFVAWTPNKSVSVVAAWVDLGSVLGPVTGETDSQNGAYLSLQVGF